MNLFTFVPARKLSVVSVLSLFLFFYTSSAFGQIPVDYETEAGGDPAVLVQQYLIGQGIVTSNITHTGATLSRGRFWGTSNLGIEEGLILSSGNIMDSDGPDNSNSTTTQFNSPGDPTLAQLAGNGQPSNDASILEFDFIPESNTVEFRYVFGSEEWDTYANSSFNDVFGFFISGPGIYGGFPSPPEFPNGAINIALLPILAFPPLYVSINNINNGTSNNGPCENCQFFVHNDENYVEYNAFTTVLTASAVVEPCQTYHIKLSVSDIGDWSYDSGVFLEANSFSSVGLDAQVAFTHSEVDTAVEGCNDASVGFELFEITPANYNIAITLGGTAIFGEDYTTIPADPTLLTIPMGDTAISLTIVPIEDGIPEDLTETVELIYNSSLCGENMDTLTVFIKDLQPFSSYASPGQTINCEDTLTLRAGADGGQVPYYYTWSTGDVLDSIVVSPPNPITYTVTISDVCGQSETQTIDINVIGPVAVAVDDVSLCYGSSTSLNVDGGTSWLWSSSPPDATLVGQETLQTINVTPLVTTVYTAKVFDACGNEDQDDVTVFVGELTANAGADATICTGQSVDLTAQPSGNWNYVWVDEFGNPAGTGQTISVSPTAQTTYTVTISDINCPTLIDTDDITVDVVVMNINVSPNDTICEGDQTTLWATSSLGGGVFVWSDGVNSYPGQTISVSPSVTTTYIVTVDDGCIKDGPPVTVNVNPLPPVSATAPVSAICPDDNITLTASGAVSYVWLSSDPTLIGQENSSTPNVTPTATTTYYLTGTDGNSCVNTDEITIDVKDRMFATFDLSVPEICEGDDMVITYTGNGTVAATYDWDFGGGVSSGTGQGPNQVHWDVAGTKTVTLTVTQNACVSEQVIQTIDVNEMPQANFTKGISSGCVPLTVDFTDASTNTVAGATYEWDFGTGSVYNQQSPSPEFTQPGQYNVSLTVTNPGCSNTITSASAVDAWPLPVPGINANPLKVSMKNPLITFSSTSTGDNLTYQWLTGDGASYDVPDFTHTYADSGIYQVKIIVENSYGCVDSTFETVIVTARYMLRIPSAFTPNGDGLNDQFVVKGNGVKEFRMSIYDRWGKSVFESKDINKSWDGMIKGHPPVPGVYLYHTFFKDDNDEVSEQTGSFVIIK